jgi:hypothetical protein
LNIGLLHSIVTNQKISINMTSVQIEKMFAESDGQIKEVEGQIKKVEGQIEDIEDQINKVTVQITEATVHLVTLPADANDNAFSYWQDKEKQLREEKKQLREEKNLLREEKKLLRDEEKLLREEKKELREAMKQLKVGNMPLLQYSIGGSALIHGKSIEDADDIVELVKIDEIPRNPEQLSTPSKNDDRSILMKKCVIVECEGLPLSITVPRGYKQNPYSKQRNEELDGEDISKLLGESYFYGVASQAPSWIDIIRRGKDAKQNRTAIFPDTDGGRKYVSFANFEPEFFARVKKDEIPSPPFNGEIKSAGSGTDMFDEIANYVLFGIIDSFFQDNSNSKRRFYENVPVGYGLMAMAHVGYLVCLELIGKAFLTPCSNPFFLGSLEHETAINGLKQNKELYNTFHILDYSQKLFQSCTLKKDKIFFTKTRTEDGFFWKIIRYDAFEGRNFQSFYHVYQQYQILTEADLQENHLIPAKLLFGELELAVRMPFLAISIRANLEDEAMMQYVAVAIKYLGEHKLLYTDLREPNILVDENEKVWLADYDDMVIQDEALTTMDDFETAMSLLDIPKANNYMDKGNTMFLVFRKCLSNVLSSH